MLTTIAASMAFILVSGVVALRRMLQDEEFLLENLTLPTLGLSEKWSKNRKPHCILSLQGIRTRDEYIQSLSSRSARINLRKADSRLSSNNIRVVPAGVIDLDQRHYEILVSHNQRTDGHNLSRTLLYLACQVRWLCATKMKGFITEYYKENNNGDHNSSSLIAWDMRMAKGKTLRAMWFYQSVTTEGIYFESIGRSMDMALSLEMDHIDLGPGKEDLKAKYGYHCTDHWKKEWIEEDGTEGVNSRYLCDYSGPFLDLSRFVARDSTS